jgi:ABC-type glycerol-3-phosphate transport system substrate-binding protein
MHTFGVWVVASALAMGAWLMPTLADAQAKVKILAVTSPETRGLKAMAVEFTKKTGIQVEFSEQGRLGYFESVITQLVAGTDAFDLAQINSTFVTELAAAGAIEFWDEHLNNGRLTNLAEYDVKDIPVIYRYNGKITMIPTDAMSQLLYYRSDLISAPPQTWDEVLATAKKWTKSLNPQSPTPYGNGVTAMPGPEAPKVFYPVLWSFGGEVFDSQMNPHLTSPEAIRAAEFYRSLRPVLPPDYNSYNYPKVLDGLRNGTLAMASVYWNAAYNDIQASNSPHKDAIKVALVPGVKKADGTISRRPQTHSWGLVFNKRSPSKEAAWKFLLYATGKEGGRIHGKNGGSPFRTSILQDPAWASGPYYSLMVQTLAIATPEPQVTFYSKMHEVMNQMISATLDGKEPIPAVLERTNASLKALLPPKP